MSREDKLIAALERITQRGHPSEAFADLTSGAALRWGRGIVADLEAWQDWARALLDDLGRLPVHGDYSYLMMRDLIAQLAGMAPGVPRCLRCGCFATRHEVDDEELGACADCECTGFESPAAGNPAGNSEADEPNGGEG